MNYYVKNYCKQEVSDSDAIEACLKEAVQSSEKRTIIFDGKDYYIDRAILVPSDTEIIVDGCMIKQKEQVFDNIFRGANLILDEEYPYGAPLEVKPQQNIRILGKNGARLMGTALPKVGYHTFLQEEQLMVGDFWGWRTHMLSFSRGVNIEIGGLSLSQTMGWSTCFDSCSEVYVHDMDIRSHVKNGDGVNFRSGCHHCRIENITGFTSDDTVACTALGKKGERVPNNRQSKYLYPGEPYNSTGHDGSRDIHDISIKNIKTGGRMHGIICLTSRGNQVYNVSIENVDEQHEGYRESTVKLYTGYGDGVYNPGDLHDITVRNVTGRMSKYAVQTNAELKNVTVENITQLNPEGEVSIGF